MKKIKLLAITAFVLASVSVWAQETALWMRYPAISPDGTSIAFNYKGDSW